MRAYTFLLAFALLLVSSASAAHADIIFNNGTTNTVTSPINDRVQILNNTVVTFNAGGNVTAFSSLGGFLTASLAAVSVFDTSRVIDNAANLRGDMSTGGCNVNSASGLSAAVTSEVYILGGSLTGFISSGGGFGCTASNTASGLRAQGSSMVSVSGGTFTGSISSGGFIDNFASGLSAAGNSIVSVSGGTFMGIVSSGGGGVLRAQGLSATGNSLVSVSGGSFTARGASSNLGLLVLDNARVTLFGNDFNFPFGPISPSTGTITGTLQSGESIDFSFFQSRSGQIILSSFDTDDDGVLDGFDSCPGTPAREVVNTEGCAIAQLCPCDNPWKNHAAYVSCVAHTAEDFVTEDLITEAEKDAIVSEAGQSSCGKKK